MKKHYLIIGLLSLATFTSCKKELNQTDGISGELAGGQGTGGQKIFEENFVPNEILVKFKKGTSEDAKANVLARIGGKVSEKVLTKAMQRVGDDEGFFVVNVPIHALEAINRAKGDDAVLYAEPNYIYTHDATSSDPYFTNGNLWGMKGGNGSNAEAAWAAGKTGSTSVYIGIIDEGIQYNHPDLDGQVQGNPGEVSNGIDDDGNGYIDDTRGWDFDGNNNSIYDGGTNGGLDDHGTHVAGTIGGKANSVGVVGVSWNVRLISGKFLRRRGGTTANAVKAVDYFTTLKSKGLNVVATNNSWGGGGYGQALYDAISRANAAGILFIAAAGNGGSDQVGDNNDVTASYPSNYDLPNVIAVAAIDKNGGLGSFSNYGAKTVDIGAPGVAISSSTAYNTLSSYSGTSMATPHVTGGVALYAAAKPGSSVATIRNAILSTAVATPSLATKTVTGGRLDVNAALSK